MADDTPDSEVKITDFGLSKAFDEQTQVMQTPCGTPGYIAPEAPATATADTVPAPLPSSALPGRRPNKAAQTRTHGREAQAPARTLSAPF